MCNHAPFRGNETDCSLEDLSGEILLMYSRAPYRGNGIENQLQDLIGENWLSHFHPPYHESENDDPLQDVPGDRKTDPLPDLTRANLMFRMGDDVSICSLLSV